jgi:hypothetical protein
MSSYLRKKLDSLACAGYTSGMRTRRDSISDRVRAKITRGGREKVWTYGDFTGLPTMAVAASLSRLCKRGVIRRLRKGVYYVPRWSRFGDIVPEAPRVAAAVLKHRGFSFVAPSGVPAYNRLGLTTQVSGTPMFVTDRGTRSLDVGDMGNVVVRFAQAVRGIRPDERAALDALRDVRRIPDSSPAEVVLRLANLFKSGRLSFERVARLSRKEPARVRALLGAIGSYIASDPVLLAELRKSLNPTTRFKLGMSTALPTARDWKIR